MIVWIVFVGHDYEGDGVEKVFSSKNKALNYIKDTYPIYEMEPKLDNLITWRTTQKIKPCDWDFISLESYEVE